MGWAVSGDGQTQFFGWVVTDIAQIFQLQIKEHGVFVRIQAVDIALADHAGAPAAAAAAVFQAD